MKRYVKEEINISIYTSRLEFCARLTVSEEKHSPLSCGGTKVLKFHSNFRLLLRFLLVFL